MAVLVAHTNGKRQTHGTATHFIVSPDCVLFVYTGEENTAAYREWDYAWVSMQPGPPPADAVIPEDDEPEPKMVDKAEMFKDTRRGLSVPRGGFGSKS